MLTLVIDVQERLAHVMAKQDDEHNGVILVHISHAGRIFVWNTTI